MPTLSLGQFNVIYNILSFAIASMFASFVFFVLVREFVAKPYRFAIVISALVVFIAGYHYFRIFDSFSHAYVISLAAGNAKPSDLPFNDAYRYVDWLLTVPLLLVELVTVLRLEKAKSRSLLIRLIIAALLMIGLGYPGEVSNAVSTKLVFFVLSCIPFIYILYVLWVELSHSLTTQPKLVRPLVSLIRVILLITWLVYPIAYLIKTFAIISPVGEVGVQVGYTLADVLAKCLYGIVIYFVARAKTEADKAEGLQYDN